MFSLILWKKYISEVGSWEVIGRVYMWQPQLIRDSPQDE